ncbi:MAG TPA: thioredoxin family protein [Steroidobacteraceae bacterium]|nr:thioredoxin family protein [Steroidobacteraceae bacterium]
MAESRMIALGTSLPAFALTDTVSGKTVTSSGYAGQPLLVAFICNHCPYVVHIADALAAFANDYRARGLAIVAISSNDVTTYPQDGPVPMAAFAAQKGFTFPYLYDETQQVAQAYHAACTPDLFLFDRAGKLAYRGQFDSSRPNKGSATGEDLRAAADAVLAGHAPPAEQTPSMGCSIKWKAGVTPT